MAGEAEWDKQKRIDKGKKQFAVPASSVEEFLQEEEKMVEALLDRLKKRAETEGRSAEGEAKPKKKREAVEEEEAEEEEQVVKKSKKKAKVEEEEEAQEEEE
ncbi:unnamed protein product [Effrenium voratum]|nr:unnamed protein product [Effrenium voratum]